MYVKTIQKKGEKTWKVKEIPLERIEKIEKN